MKKVLFVITFVCFCIFFQSCKPHKKPVKKVEADDIINADKSFSNLSKAEGMKRAFIEYIDNEGILLRPGHLPIIGANAIDFLSQVNDSAFTLTWNPSGAEVASSGDMGYTFGMYNLQMKDTLIKGTYVSIWKKQKDGKWKFVLDSGNEGIDNGDH